MNSESEHKQTRNWIVPVLAFGLPFLFFGAIGFISSAMDARGFEKADYTSCWFFFLLFGISGGVVGLSIRPIMKWWREPHEEKK
jgi:heme/copper-type cytochrome/quinol oxidase subunit 3